jgi:hypothetical protein
MKRRTSAPAELPEPGQDDEDRGVGRRALLTRGGVVAAGVVGAGVAGAAVAGTANAATNDPVLQGNVNPVGTNVPATEISATNNTAATPTAVLTNLGSTGTGEASPSLRLTPAATGLVVPSASTSGGDMVATNDGELWFTHNIPNFGPSPAIVHTDANSNTFVPLTAPVRMLDTRSSAGRVHVIDPSGKFDSSGRLKAGQTIHIDLSSLVFFADAMTANLTVIGPLAGGWLVLWSGAVARPNTSSINFAKGQALSNMTVSGVAFNTGNGVSSIAIFTTVTTQVLLDVVGFSAPGFEFVTGASRIAPATRAAHIRTARAAIAKRPT